MGKHNQLLGRRGEDAAAAYLTAYGHRILERNWRTPTGELDLVSELAGQVIAVEVKTRTTDRFGSGFEAISAVKYRRIQRLILQWAGAQGRYLARIRIDVIALMPGNPGWRIEHYEDVAP